MNNEDLDRCTEVLADGTIYTFSINKSGEKATELLHQLHAMEGKELDFDYTAAVFSLFVDCVHILTASGWTTEDLLQEVVDHSEFED